MGLEQAIGLDLVDDDNDDMTNLFDFIFSINVWTVDIPM